MIITLCSSTTFYKELPRIKTELEKINYQVFLPSMKDYHGMEESAFAKIQNDLIRKHLLKIDLSNAVYIVNQTKDKIEGYIGGNTLIEMSHAFYRDIPIFLSNEIPRELRYKEEIIAMKPIVIGEDWEELDRVLKQHYQNLFLQ